MTPNIRIALIQIISIALILKYRKINAVLIKKFLSGELVALANSFTKTSETKKINGQSKVLLIFLMPKPRKTHFAWNIIDFG